MIFVEISDKNKMMLLEYEDKGQHCFVTTIKMRQKAHSDMRKQKQRI